MQFFSGSFDIISVHSHKSSHDDTKSEADTIYSDFGLAKPIWITECDFSGPSPSGQADNVTLVYVDEFNRQSYWTKLFYNLGGYSQSCNGLGLLCGNGGSTLMEQPAFTAYQQVYAPH